ncbi:MAG TPA: hypothetical protein VGB83_06555 [Actinomycetota bacterium]
MVEVTIADGPSEEDVEVQPGGAGRVQFMVISSNTYGDALTYKINVATAGLILLDAKQFLVGNGAIGLLDQPPEKLLFTNGLGQEVSIQIIVGRQAITPFSSAGSKQPENWTEKESPQWP